MNEQQVKSPFHLAEAQYLAADFRRLEEHTMRTFETGATRDSDDTKIDYEGFLSPVALRRFGEYMTKHRVQADGALRDSDNWQKGIPPNAYMKSLLRHVFDVWALHRGRPEYADTDSIVEALCATLFNVQGMLHEYLK